MRSLWSLKMNEYLKYLLTFLCLILLWPLLKWFILLVIVLIIVLIIFFKKKVKVFRMDDISKSERKITEHSDVIDVEFKTKEEIKK